MYVDLVKDFGALPPSQNAQVHRPEHYSLLALAQIFIISSFFQKRFLTWKQCSQHQVNKAGKSCMWTWWKILEH
jgi:hypothetical protein